MTLSLASIFGVPEFRIIWVKNIANQTFAEILIETKSFYWLHPTRQF